MKTEGSLLCFFFFFQAEDGIRDMGVTGVQTCALPICRPNPRDHGGRGTPRTIPAVEILAAATETLRVPAAVDLAAIVVGALTGGLLAAREGFAVSGVLLLAFTGGLGGGLVRGVLLGDLPPVGLTNPAYLPTVTIAATVTFYFSGWLSRLTGLLVVLDAVTLGFFTVLRAPL